MGKGWRKGHALLGLSLILLIAAAALYIGIGQVRQKAEETEKTYLAEAAVTAVPTPTIHAIGVTHDPALITPVPNISSGSAGDSVRTVQSRLKELGYYQGEVDGGFGGETRLAVVLFQAQHGLSADGIAGPKTLEKLLSADAHPIVTTDTLSGAKPLLVNASHPVGKDFVPADLVRLADVLPKGILLESASMRGVREAAEALGTMLAAAEKAGIGNWKVRESWRTWQDQENIFNNKVKEHRNAGLSEADAKNAARLTVADPGTSEHHTGLAFDLNVPGESFGDTANYAWLAEHCWEYGFILRYTDEKEDVTGFLGEEWHYRYVGKEHSLKIRDLGICLEEYE